MKSLGDFDTSAVIYGKFTTFRPSTGAAYTLAGTPALSVYKDNSTTQSTTGVTLTADFDSVTGLNHFAIDTSADGTFYSSGSFFDIVITAGTVDSVSVVGSVVASFTLRKTSALKPTAAGRSLDVTTTGEAGIDWANIGSPTTTVNLSATTVKTATDVETDTADIQSRLPAALGANGNIKADVRDFSGTAGTFASGRPEVNTSHIAGSAVSTSSAQIGVNVVNAGGTAWGSGAITAASIATDAITAAKIAADAIGASELAADAVAEIADQVWDEVLSGHLTGGSTGSALNAAGSAGDPWATALPGAYSSGTAGYIIGTNINATISSRMATFTLPTNFSALAITVGGIVQADLQTIKTQAVTCSGGVTIPAATLASTTNITAGTITTATNVTTVNGLAAGVITAAAIADGAIDRATFAADTGMQTIRSNTAQAGAAGTITLDASASSTNDFYKGQLIFITGGTGAGQPPGLVFSYVGSTKVATMYNNWTTTPDNTSTFAIKDFYGHGVNSSLQAVSDMQSINGIAGGNVTGISSLGTAYNAGTLTTNITGTISTVTTLTNLPAITTDWITAAGVSAGAVTKIQTGLATPTNITAGTITTVSGNVAGSVNSVTSTVSADMISVSGDSTAADNLESYLDGTLFMPVDAHKPVFSIVGTMLTVKKPDGTTTAYTRTLSTDAAADPVIGSS